VEINVISAAALMRSLQEMNGRLIINIEGGVFGHCISEIDNYARLRISEEIPRDTPCLLFASPANTLSSVIDLFPGIFELVSMDIGHKNIADHVANCHPELTIDVGHSSYKVAPPACGYTRIEHEHNQFTYRTSFLNGIYADILKYYKRIKLTSHDHPLRINTPCPETLREFVSPGGHPVVVLAQRQELSSGTKAFLPNDMYRPVLEYLKDSGYSIVFSGRETLPKEWKIYDVIDYANSHLANVHNDFHLYRLAKFGVLPSSGTCALAEVQCLPYVLYNTAVSAIPSYSKKSIVLPSMLRYDDDEKMCSVATQIRHNLQYGINTPPGMHVQSVTGEDILSAVLELESLIDNWTPRSKLQQRWVSVDRDLWEGNILWEGKTLWEGLARVNMIDGYEELADGTETESLYSFSESRVAQKFLHNHQDFLFG
jgi:putative glycosyltransferase (TIGR04372 family)